MSHIKLNMALDKSLPSTRFNGSLTTQDKSTPGICPWARCGPLSSPLKINNNGAVAISKINKLCLTLCAL